MESRASSLDAAAHFLKAAALADKEGTGLSYLIKQRNGLMRQWWHFRDPVLHVSWQREDYVMALCMLAALAEAGDLPL